METALNPSVAFRIDPKHYRQHNYLTYCNDVLVSILQYVDSNKLSWTKLVFKDQADSDAFEQFEKESDDWQDWLLQHGYRDEMYEAYFRHTFFSLISDFCSYMLESINCAAKMKVAVSYALLRKPLKDTLGYIEWLYVDRDELLDLFVQGNPGALEIKRSIARKHTSLIEERRGITSYYNFRYDTASETSLEHIWNNANHLVTTRCNFSKTAPGNLNFVFTDENGLRKFSDYYYITVPAIMSYALELICDMFESFAPLAEYTVLINKVNRTVKALSLVNGATFDDLKCIYAEVGFPIVCPECNTPSEATSDLLLSMANDELICPHCQKKVDTTRYMFDWEDTTPNS